MTTTRLLVLCFMLVATLAGCGQRRPAPKETRQRFIGALEKAHGQLAAEVSGGQMPADAGKMARSAELLETRTNGTQFATDAVAINKQVQDLDTMLTGKKASKEQVQAALNKLKESIDAFKAKEES